MTALVLLLAACTPAPARPATTRAIVFVTLTSSPASEVTATDAPLPFRDLSTLTPGATGEALTPDAGTATLSPADLPPASASAEAAALAVIQPTAVPASGRPSATLQPPAPTAAPVQPVADVASAEQAVIDLSNAYRAANGLPPLRRDEAVMAIARGRSADMVARDYFGHTDPITGVHLAKAQVLALGYGRAGENIYWGGTALAEFPAQAVNWFIGDAPHRDNILGSGYTIIGVGIAWNGRGWALTQNFGGP
jgi:uncharacterized protein YkwD